MPELIAEVRIPAVPDAAAVQAPHRMLVVEDAAMLVSPVPREETARAQQPRQLPTSFGPWLSNSEYG